MILYIDSREQLHLPFEVTGNVSRVIRTALPYGDYGAAWEPVGTEDLQNMPIVFERKSLADLWGTFSRHENHERFKREMCRAKDDKVKLVLIVEGTLCDVLAGNPRSQMEGKTLLKILFTFWVKYDLQVVFCSNRAEMKRYITEAFEAIERCWKPKTEVRDEKVATGS